MFVFIVGLIYVCSSPRDQLLTQVQDIIQERQVLTSYHVSELDVGVS